MVAAGLQVAAQQPTGAPHQGSTAGGTQSNSAPSLSAPSSSGSRPESNPFYDELKQPWQLYRAGKLENAAAGFRLVLERATAVENKQAQAWARDALGTIFDDKAEYPAARGEFEQALWLYQSSQDPEGEATANEHLGNVWVLMGDNALARQYYRKALKTFEQFGMLRRQAGVMGKLSHTDDPEREELNQRALHIGRELGDKGLQASVLNSIGDGFFSKGIFDAAQEHYQQAAALYDQAKEPIGLARVLTSEGRLQRAHGHPEKSLELYAQALKLQQENHDRQGAIQSINAMAVAYQELGDLAKSAGNYQQALSMAKETGSERIVNFELANLAGIYINLGRDREAAEILENLLQQNPALEWAYLRYLSLSIAYYHLGKFQQSSEAAGKSVEIARAGKHLDALPDAFVWKARSEEKSGNLERALASAQESLQAIEELRTHLVPSDFMKRGFAEQTQRTFGFSIQLLTAAHQSGRALEVAEQARSRAFLDLLATRSLQNAGAAPDASTLWRQWTSLDVELRSPVSVQPSSLAEVQATARRLDSTVLSYWVSPDATYVWVVSPDGEVHSASSEVSSKRLQELIGALWSGGSTTRGGNQAPPARTVRTRGGDVLGLDTNTRNNWRELYKLLIQPVEKWLPDRPGSLLTIEPHGPLLMLPFAALRNAQGHYLLERFTLHYVPAISLLEFTRETKPEAFIPGVTAAGVAPRHYLLVADPAGIPNGPNGKPLPALPGARREVSAIARLLPVSDVTRLEGSQATEKRVQELAGQSTVIHFATHGIIRDDHPFDSFLALGSSGQGRGQDGRLTAQDIYSLHLHSDLVFLSACRSGLGVVSGDGILGLTRAFLYAGTPSVIASLWDVADEPTYRLTSSFYRGWLQGKNKGAALRSAQLSLLRALRAGEVRIHTSSGDVILPENPVFWASFVLEGAP